MAIISKLCPVIGCNKLAVSHKLCEMHYGRLRKYGHVGVAKSTRFRSSPHHTNTSEYLTWCAMRKRCNNPKDTAYRNYGGRGIKVCDRWQSSFFTFLDDMGHKPGPEYSIDRIDVNGNYEPSNCRWATKTQQVLNRRIKGDKTSGYKGVRKINVVVKVIKWKASIFMNGRTLTIGVFETKEEAAKAYNEVALKYYGADARLNNLAS